MKKGLLVLTLLFTLILSGCLPEYSEPIAQEEPLSEEEIADLILELMPEQNVNTTYDLATFQEAVVDMVAIARGGVVGIISISDDGFYGSGSGVVYKKDGNQHYIITNHHVVENTIDLTVVYEKNGLLFTIEDGYIELVGTDPTTDLAVLKVNTTENFQVIPFADSYDVELGEFVVAIGNPLGFEYYGTVTMGIVSGLSRYVEDGEFNATLLQHDAAISPGNSGGALLNINGELVGINNMKIVDENVSNIGFAIPSNTVKRIAEDLEEDGIVTRPYLGIRTYAQTNVCGETYGVCISVEEGGAAYEAGLQDGDTIIGYKLIDMEEFIVINNFNDLKEAILNSKVGDEIIIKYIRNGEELISHSTMLDVHPDDK